MLGEGNAYPENFPFPGASNGIPLYSPNTFIRTLGFFHSHAVPWWYHLDNGTTCLGIKPAEKSSSHSLLKTLVFSLGRPSEWNSLCDCLSLFTLWLPWECRTVWHCPVLIRHILSFPQCLPSFSPLNQYYCHFFNVNILNLLFLILTRGYVFYWFSFLFFKKITTYF